MRGSIPKRGRRGEHLVGFIMPTLLSIGLLGAASLLANNFSLDPAHTLHENGRWQSTKATLEMGSLGAISFMVTTTALAQNRLDLGAWNGFQEVIYRNPVRLRRMTLDFLLARSASLAVVFNKTERGYSGLQLSTSAGRGSYFFTADSEGRFVKKQEVGVVVEAERPLHLSLQMADRAVRAKLENRDLGAYSLDLARQYQVGFRCQGDVEANVDNIVLTDHQGRVILEERFEPQRRSSLPLILLMAAAVLINAALLIRHRRRPFVWWILALGNLLILITTGAAYLVAQKSAGAYPSGPGEVNWHGYKRPDLSPEYLLQKIEEQSEGGKGGHLRVLFLGGSQIFGQGASIRERTTMSRVCSWLGRETAMQQEVQCINAGMPGQGTSLVLKRYTTRWLAYKPHLTVLVASYNDQGRPDEFKENVERIIVDSRRQSAEILLVAEPARQRNRELDQNHRILRELARRHSVPLVDPQAYLEARREQGFLWWDNCHLTDYGQELLARRIHQAMLGILKNRPRSLRR